MNYAIFRPDGSITKTVSCPVSLIEVQLDSEEENYVEVEGSTNTSTQYIPDILNPVVTDKPEMPIKQDKKTVLADGIEEVTLSGIPLKALLDVSGGEISHTETLETTTETFTFDHPETYGITLTLYPYIPFFTQIVATPIPTPE